MNQLVFSVYVCVEGVCWPLQKDINAETNNMQTTH